MKIPLSLIKKFIDIAKTPKEIAEALILLGVEVDAIVNETPSFKGVIAAKITETATHPQADKLKILKVTDGKEELQIVCGEPTVENHLHVALAKLGAELKGDHPFIIKKAKLRGIESFGMLCTAKELGLYEDHNEVLRIDSKIPIGTNLDEYLWDPVFEISLTPNLGHCQGAYGIARLLASYFDIPLKKPSIKTFSAKPLDISIQDSKACPRYAAALVENIEITPSPFWLKTTLEISNTKSINSIVDITNYMLLLFGQPMHAFDHALLKGSKITIDTAKETQNLRLLDNIDYEIPKESLLIQDEKKPIALAGIMGAKNSSIHEKTKNILLESAFFSSSFLRKTSKKTMLRTESYQCFEKGTDPDANFTFLSYAISLIQKIYPQAKLTHIGDMNLLDNKNKKIILKIERVHSVLGIKLAKNEIKSILKRLWFQVEDHEENSLNISVPLYRHDINAEIDLIEDIAILYGYNSFDRKDPLIHTSNSPHCPLYLWENRMRKKAISQGLTEFLTPVLISPKLASITQEISFLKKDMVSVLHSKSEEYSVLRPSLMPDFLTLAKHNIYNKNQSISGFEIGKIHFKKKDQYFEQIMLAVLLTGKKIPHHFDDINKNVDFFDLKGSLENILREFSLDFIPSSHASFHPTRQSNIHVKEQDIGAFGEIHSDILRSFDIKQKIFFAEVNLTILLSLQDPQIKMKSINMFPSSERDWTFTVKKELDYRTIMQAIEAFDSPILEGSYLLDIYESDKLGKDKKNITLRFVYRNPEKTLSFEEVEIEHEKMQKIIQKQIQDYIFS